MEFLLDLVGNIFLGLVEEASFLDRKKPVSWKRYVLALVACLIFTAFFLLIFAIFVGLSLLLIKGPDRSFGIFLMALMLMLISSFFGVKILTCWRNFMKVTQDMIQRKWGR